MIVDGNQASTPSSFECDVCVLGGGVAGIVLACELKKKFQQVLVVESGDEHFTPEAQALYRPQAAPKHYPDPEYSRLRFLGGSSNHWENNTAPMTPLDFEQRDWIPDSGWPISYTELAPFYAGAGDYCGVGRDGYSANDWLTRLSATDVVDGSEVIQTQIAKFAAPPARFFHTHKQVLLAGGAVTVLKNSNVVDLDFDEGSTRVRAVSTMSNQGRQASVEARVFVLCCGGIENARLLLAFNQKYDQQLGNQYDNVGRYFMGHPTPRAAQLLVPDPEPFAFYSGVQVGERRVEGYLSLSQQVVVGNQTTNLRMPLVPASQYMLSDGISSYHILSEALSEGDTPDHFGQHLVNFASDLDMIAEAIARKKLNKRLLSSAEDFAGFMIPMMMEQTPDRNNRIYLGSKKDKLGLPKVLIDWQLSEQDKHRVWQSLDLVAHELGALSLGRLRILQERSVRIWGSQLGFSSHHMGTTRMAPGPDRGVVDRDLRVFGTENLFVTGSSVFATGSHVPPTLTIAALTIRLARYLEKEYV